MGYTKEGQIEGGHTQAQKMYYCPSCDSIGKGNKMVHHIKTCDGSGLKNYWSKKQSIALKKYLASLF